MHQRIVDSLVVPKIFDRHCVLVWLFAFHRVKITESSGHWWIQSLNDHADGGKTLFVVSDLYTYTFVLGAMGVNFRRLLMYT